jgi:predicted  nucleic acid-binding Zn-ribbon protein
VADELDTEVQALAREVAAARHRLARLREQAEGEARSLEALEARWHALRASGEPRNLGPRVRARG